MWLNRLPGTRPDGSHYQFAGVTTLLYAGNGRWSYQEDIFNFEETRKVLAEWTGDQKASSGCLIADRAFREHRRLAMAFLSARDASEGHCVPVMLVVALS
jgi:hypothetical protein